MQPENTEETPKDIEQPGPELNASRQPQPDSDKVEPKANSPYGLGVADKMAEQEAGQLIVNIDIRKIYKYLSYLSLLGILLFAAAIYGSAHDTSCSNPLIWPLLTYICGLFTLPIGLVGWFRINKKPWVKTIVFSILITSGFAFIAFSIYISLLPGGLFHCTSNTLTF